MSRDSGADSDPCGPQLMAVGLLASVLQRAADDVMLGVMRGYLCPQTLRLTQTRGSPYSRGPHLTPNEARQAVVFLGPKGDGELCARALHGLTNVYMSPSRLIARALQRATNGGVDVPTPAEAARKAAREREARPAEQWENKTRREAKHSGGPWSMA